MSGEQFPALQGVLTEGDLASTQAAETLIRILQEVHRHPQRCRFQSFEQPHHGNRLFFYHYAR